jgi:hypothetical protein
MPWIVIHLAVIVLLGTLLFAHRNRPRDLHRAPPEQPAILSWVRSAGIGLAFFGFLHAGVQLRIYGWPGECSPSDLAVWGRCTGTALSFWVMLGMIGIALWFLLSERDHVATKR